MGRLPHWLRINFQYQTLIDVLYSRISFSLVIDSHQYLANEGELNLIYSTSVGAYTSTRRMRDTVFFLAILFLLWPAHVAYASSCVFRQWINELNDEKICIHEKKRKYIFIFDFKAYNGEIILERVQWMAVEDCVEDVKNLINVKRRIFITKWIFYMIYIYIQIQIIIRS